MARPPSDRCPPLSVRRFSSPFPYPCFRSGNYFSLLVCVVGGFVPSLVRCMFSLLRTPYGANLKTAFGYNLLHPIVLQLCNHFRHVLIHQYVCCMSNRKYNFDFDFDFYGEIANYCYQMFKIANF